MVHHLEAQQDVRACAVAKADHRLHAEVVQHVHQVLAHDLVWKEKMHFWSSVFGKTGVDERRRAEVIYKLCPSFAQCTVSKGKTDGQRV